VQLPGVTPQTVQLPRVTPQTDPGPEEEFGFANEPELTQVYKTSTPKKPLTQDPEEDPYYLPAPYALTLMISTSEEELQNTRKKDISFARCRIAGDLIDLLPNILEHGLFDGTIKPQNNRTYDDPGAKKKIHAFVPLCDFNKDWCMFNALHVLGLQLGSFWCKAFGYEPGSKVCVPYYQDPASGFSKEGLIPGFMLLYNFNPFDMEASKLAPGIAFAPHHADGIRGQNVFTLTVP